MKSRTKSSWLNYMVRCGKNQCNSRLTNCDIHYPFLLASYPISSFQFLRHLHCLSAPVFTSLALSLRSSFCVTCTVSPLQFLRHLHCLSAPVFTSLALSLRSSFYVTCTVSPLQFLRHLHCLSAPVFVSLALSLRSSFYVTCSASDVKTGAGAKRQCKLHRCQFTICNPYGVIFTKI